LRCKSCAQEIQRIRNYCGAHACRGSSEKGSIVFGIVCFLKKDMGFSICDELYHAIGNIEQFGRDVAFPQSGQPLLGNDGSACVNGTVIGRPGTRLELQSDLDDIEWSYYKSRCQTCKPACNCSNCWRRFSSFSRCVQGHGDGIDAKAKLKFHTQVTFTDITSMVFNSFQTFTSISFMN